VRVSLKNNTISLVCLAAAVCLTTDVAQRARCNTRSFLHAMRTGDGLLQQADGM